MFVFGGNVETAYARNIVDWSAKFGEGFCATFGEHYERAESETFLAFVYVLTEKLHIAFSKSHTTGHFKKSIPTKIQSIHNRRHGTEISYSRLVVNFDRMRSLLDRHLTGFLEAHHHGILPALEMHLVHIAPVLYQQTFGRVVPHMAQHLESLTSLFVSIANDVKAFALKH